MVILVPWGLLKIMKCKIAGFWKKIQIAGFWKSLKISHKRNSKSIIWKNSFFVINHPMRYCKMHIILFPKTNLKRKKNN